MRLFRSSTLVILFCAVVQFGFFIPIIVPSASDELPLTTVDTLEYFAGVPMDYSRSLEGLVVDNDFDKVSRRVKSKYFHPRGEFDWGEMRYRRAWMHGDARVKLIKYEGPHWVSFVAADMYSHGYRPATLYELLFVMEKNPEMSSLSCVIPGASVLVSRMQYRGVFVLNDKKEKRLKINYFGKARALPECYYAAVKI